jgi:hypothetical protein
LPSKRVGTRPALGESREELERRVARDWYGSAACASAPDPEKWFPAPCAAAEDLAEPLSWCASCPVRRSCLAFGLLGGESGLWGGVHDTDRAHARERIASGEHVDRVLDDLILGDRVTAAA